MDLQRYNRQIILPDFGRRGQEKLAQAKVLVIGAGGLGCPALQLLTSSGVGHIGIVDFDIVDKHNLHRQILFTEADIGCPKVEVAKQALQHLNSQVTIEAYNTQLTQQNALALIAPYDIVLDGTDNFNTRYLVNDACLLLGKPLVYGAIFRYEGQVSVFNVEKNGQRTSYRDLFPQAPAPDEVPNCNEAGVLPTLSALIGTLQANEVIKVLIGSTDILAHKLLIFSIKTCQTFTIDYTLIADKQYPKTPEAFASYDYAQFCGHSPLEQLTSDTHLQAFLSEEGSVLIDVRLPEEQPKLRYPHIQIPLQELEARIAELAAYPRVCFICAAGIRSEKALHIAKKHYPEKVLTHYAGGVKNILAFTE